MKKKMYKTKYKKNRGGVPKNLFIQRLIARPSFTKNVGKKIIPRVIRKNIRKYLEKENRYPGIFFRGR